MSSNLSVGGLASGLDINSIIDGLVQIERRRVMREEEKKKAYELKQKTFNDLKTRIADFSAKAKAMDDVKALNVLKTSSSNDTIARIIGDKDAAPGNYDVKVQKLASSLKVASKSYASDVTALGLSGSFQISVSAEALKADPTVTSVAVDIAAGDSLRDVAAKINRAKGTGATASIVNMGNNDFRLMLSGTDEGTKGFTLTPTSGTTIGAGGLGIVSSGESVRTRFDFKNAEGGPATAATTFANLFSGIGVGSAITDNDSISWTATDANGDPQDGSFTISNAATMTLQDLLAAVKAEFDDGGDKVDVSLNSSGEIVVSDKTGGTNDIVLSFSFTDADGSGSSLTMGAAENKTSFSNTVSEGQKAFYMMNGLAVSSQGNKDSSLIRGTTFELLKVDTSESVKLSMQRDEAGVKQKVQDFLDSYNALIKFLDEQSKVTVEEKKEGGATETVVKKGPFAGDNTILGLKNRLRDIITGSVKELTENNLSKYNSMASIGITSNKADGTLSINNEMFEKAVATDFEGLRRLFVTAGYSDNPLHEFGTQSKDTKAGVYAVDAGADTIGGVAVNRLGDLLQSTAGATKGLMVKAPAGSGTGNMVFVRGIAGQLSQFYTQINDFVDGTLTATSKGIQKRIADSRGQIEKLEDQVSRYKDRLIKQFTNLEQSISRLQSQSASFQNQMSGLRR